MNNQISDLVKELQGTMTKEGVNAFPEDVRATLLTVTPSGDAIVLAALAGLKRDVRAIIRDREQGGRDPWGMTVRYGAPRLGEEP